MAVTSSDEPATPKSTGRVKMPKTPVETTHAVEDNTSTGAVAYEAPGETVVEHYGQDAVVRYETPSEPVTMSLSWISDAETKVVEPAKKDAPKASDAQAETK